MKSPPDEKTLEAINAGTRIRPARGKWRIVITVGLTLVLLGIGALVTLESYRQSDIHDSRERFSNEVELTQARYSDVQDWRTWYVNTLPPDCNYEALPMWIEECGQDPAIPGTVTTWANDVPDDLSTDDVPAPSNEELQRYLSDTARFAEQAEAMLVYSRISRLPHLENDVPSFSVIDVLAAFKVLTHRTMVLRQLDDWDAAWNQLDVALRLIQKWDHPTSMVDLMLSLGVERMCHLQYAAMAASHTPPDEFLQYWKDQPKYAADLEHRVIEYELVFFTQLMTHFDKDDPETWRYLTHWEKGEWLDYLSPKLDWDDRKTAFNGESMVLDALTDYVRQMRITVENPNGRMADLTLDNPLLSSYTILPNRVNWGVLLRQGSALLSRLLLARHEGEVSAATTQAAADFPDHEVFIDGTDIVIRVRYVRDLLARLPDEYTDEEEFYESFKPVRIPLKP